MLAKESVQPGAGQLRDAIGGRFIVLVPSQHCAPHLLSGVSYTACWQLESARHARKQDCSLRLESLR